MSNYPLQKHKYQKREIMNKIVTYIFSLFIFMFSFNACYLASKTDADLSVVDQVVNVKQYPVEDFLRTVSYYGGSFSPNNKKVLVTSNQTGIYNVYAIPINGGSPIPLTESTDQSISSRGYFPNDERFLYSSDLGGNELSHIYVKEVDGRVVDLTPGDTLKAYFSGWSQDDKSFFIQTNERDERYFDVYEYDLVDYKRKMIYQNDEGYDFADISADKNIIILSKTISNASSDIYIYDRISTEMKLITEHEGDIEYNPQTISLNGKSVYYTTDENSEFTYLVKYGINTEEKEVLLKFDWDIWYAYFSKNEKYMIVGINNDAKTELIVYDVATMTPIDLPEIENAEISSVGFSRDEGYMRFYSSSSRTPRDLFIYDFNGSITKLTNSLNKNINSNDLVDGKVVRFKSFDGLEIPGVLYKPHQASENNKLPALVWVHGGPGGQSRLGYSGMKQYIINRGYVVYAINNRGSSGYGKTFNHLDDQKHGEGDLSDCVHSKKMLIETGYVDENKIGIIGGSYGGYMTLAAMTFRPEEFAVGVDIFGVSNWLRTLQNIPAWWESYRKALEEEMGDFEDEEYLKSISPLFHADKVIKPLIVLQGANDPRVLQVESDEIVAAVKKNNIPVEYIVFEDEGHGFRKNENKEEAYKKIVQFLDTYLK